MLVALMFGCGVDGPAPRIEAHRGGAGYWPENSRTAVAGAIEAGFDGIELDVVLTRDHVPVLMHDPWVDPERCTRNPDTVADGWSFFEPFLVRHVRYETLSAQFLCGGIPDARFPNALVVAEPVLSLDELLSMLHDAPAAMVVHLDLKQEALLTGPPDVFARAVLDRWFAADVPQSFYVSSPYPEVLAAFSLYGRSIGFDVPTSLSYPEFPSLLGGGGRSRAEVALSLEAERWANGLDYVAVARNAGADGLALQWEVADRTLVRAARDEGVEIVVWTIDDPRAIRQWTGLADVVVTNFPGDVP